jgi:transcription elongation factor Elf1
MYKDANLSLKRKADKCLQYKPVDRILDRDMICMTCDSQNIIRNGVRNNMIRYKCKDCGKGFSMKQT